MTVSFHSSARSNRFSMRIRRSGGSSTLVNGRIIELRAELFPGLHGRFIYNTMKIHAVNPGL